MNNIKNSSGKIVGYTDIIKESIIIHSNVRPELIIVDDILLKAIKDKDINEDILKLMYDKYYLSCGEIASLFGLCYSNINKRVKKIPMTTKPNAGRRNRAYGKKQSDATKKKISISVSNYLKSHPQIPYERTETIRKKISTSLKKYYKGNPQNPLPHIKNWENGVYKNVDFHRGIGGHFYSIKNQKQIFFRSLLELFYMLILEEDEKCSCYEYEPIAIHCDNGRVYIPDLLVNKNEIIELKSRRYIEKAGLEIKQAVEYKAQQAQKYCSQNNLKYKIVFDEDINFDSRRYKRHLKNNPQIIEKYQIVFNSPKRMVIK